MKEPFGFAALVFWLAGIVLSKGLGGSLAAIFFPPYAWYLVVEKCMQLLGII